MKIKVNKTETPEIYPNELCDEYEKEDNISCKSCENSALATQREITMEQLRKTLFKILTSDYIDRETKDFILQDEDLFPLIEEQWNTYKRFNKEKESALKFEGGKVYLQEYQ